MSVTAKEIAKKLGISQATVSVALNNKPGVSTALKQKILETAEEMGYEFKKERREQTASGTIFLIVYKATGREITNYSAFEEIHDGIRKCAHKAGYRINVQKYFERTENLNDLLAQIRSSDCVGLILFGSEISRLAVRIFMSLKLPTVLVDAYYDSIDCTIVTANNMQGSYLATSYLIENYHTTPGLLNSSYAVSKYQDRLDGYQKALSKNAIKFSSAEVIPLSLSIEMAMAEMLEYIDSGKPIARCYFSVSDRIAIGAMKALQLRGYRIPEDVAIIGFGNIRESRIVEPQLTTVNVPRETIGEIAANCLISEIEGYVGAKLRIQVATKLIKRFTTTEDR